MKYIAEIDVMPLKALLDPQGKVVKQSMHKIGFEAVEDVRIGKHITLEIEAENIDIAKQKVDESCQKILINPIMEGYEFRIEEAK